MAKWYATFGVIWTSEALTGSFFFSLMLGAIVLDLMEEE